MAFPRPTVKQIYDRILADVRSGLGGPSLTRGVATTLAAAFAGAVWLCYLFLEWCYRMLLPTSSEGEYLDEWCKRYGIERKVASCALGTARFHGEEGAVIAEGTEILRGDGVRYATTAEATIAAGETTSTAPIRATTAGEAGNCDGSAPVTFASSVLGVESVELDGPVTGGADDETDDDLRERLLERIQNPPQGGSAADYKRWAKSVPGVEEAYVYSAEDIQPGDVQIYIADFSGETAPEVAPSVAAAVSDYIAPLRPVTANVIVSSVIPVAVKITVQTPGAVGQSEIETQLKSLFARVEPSTTVSRARIDAAISQCSSFDDHQIVEILADGIASPDGIRLDVGELPQLDEVVVEAL